MEPPESFRTLNSLAYNRHVGCRLVSIIQATHRGMRVNHHHKKSIVITTCFLFFVTMCAGFTQAQNKVSVTVDAAQPVNVLTSTTIGIYTQLSDANWLNPQVYALLHVAGFTAVEYPNGWYGQADLYHWSTNKNLKWGNSNPPKMDFVQPQNNTGNLAQFAQALGAAVLQVNYGTNMQGTGGGEPKEAAAWVAYANGDPASAQTIGKDSTGTDWKTVGYWAMMRASTPLAKDDGYNFLRINHPQPLHWMLWSIGNEVYNNGYYGEDHATETDLHAPYPDNPKDNGKRRKNPNLSPEFYGKQLNEYAKEMKAVDPKIMIGASLNLPPNDYGWGEDWDRDVLKTACANIDYVSLHWHPSDTLPPDWKNLDEARALAAPQVQLPKTVSELLYLYKKNCPSGHTPRVAFTEMSIADWTKIQSPVVPALFAADALALSAEMGTLNVDWFQLHNNGLLTDDNKPLPAYYGAQMLHIVAFAPGDEFLTARSSDPNLTAYATLRRNGVYGLMLINKNPSTPASVHVDFKNAAFSGNGIRFDYGLDQSKAGSPMQKAQINGIGKTIDITVPPYSITDVLIFPAKK